MKIKDRLLIRGGRGIFYLELATETKGKKEYARDPSISLKKPD
jgi:hypothetical protein